MPVHYLLEVQQLYKTVTLPTGELRILNNLNFTIEGNQTLAILGASGSGKSTLLSIMAGLDPDYEGSVKLLGHELKDMSEDQRSSLRKNNVGFVFQSFLLIPELNAIENICLPLEISGKMSSRELEKANLLLEKIGLKDRSNHYPSTLSGGEQQRIALARAFVMEPKILFLDEPTGSLDSENGQRVVELLFDLNTEFGTTIIMVTHDTDISQQCDKVLVLKSGMLV